MNVFAKRASFLSHVTIAGFVALTCGWLATAISAQQAYVHLSPIIAKLAAGQPFYGLIEPIELAVPAAAVDQVHAGRALGNPPGHQQRDERTAHAPDQTEHRQRADVGAASDAKDGDHDRQRQDNGQVGDEKQKNPFTHDDSRIAPRPVRRR